VVLCSDPIGYSYGDVVEREFGGTAFGTYRVERPLGSATTKRAQVRAILEQLIEAELSPGDAIPSYALRIRPGRPVIRVERLRTADGTPMAYEVGYYPSILFPGLLQRELGALYDVFASEYGVVVTSGEQTVRAEAADAQQARILGTTKRAPLLVQERVTYAGERAIELSTSWYRADRYRIHMAITPRGAREN